MTERNTRSCSFHRPALACAALVALLLAGCRGQTSDKPPIHPQRNMFNQESYDAQEHNVFFADGRANRPPVPGTVARGGLKNDTVFFRGVTADGQFVSENPVPIDMALLRRGQERYEIFCSPCHDGAGTGQGMTMRYPRKLGLPGFPPPPSLHEQRIRDLYDGQIFDVITYGVRTMPSYAMQIPTGDRWAIVAYVRALQRSQNASRSDIPIEQLDTLVNR